MPLDFVNEDLASFVLIALTLGISGLNHLDPPEPRPGWRRNARYQKGIKQGTLRVLEVCMKQCVNTKFPDLSCLEPKECLSGKGTMTDTV